MAVSDPPLRLDVPYGWQPSSLTVLERQFKEQLPTLSGDVAKAWQYEIDLIDTGQLRSVFVGPSAIPQFTASIQLIVPPPAKDLAAAVARQQEIDASFSGPSSREELDVTLPFGAAVRVIAVSHPIDGSPTQDIEYLLRLGDGTTLLLTGTAPASDNAFRDVMSHVAESLTRG